MIDENTNGDYAEFGSGFSAQYDYITERNRKPQHPAWIVAQLIAMLLLGAVAVIVSK